MKHFKIKSLNDWHSLDVLEIIEFFVKNKQRNVVVEFNVSERVEVFGSHDPDMKDETLLAGSDGKFIVEVSTGKPLYLRVSGSKKARIFIKTRTPDHRVEQMSEEKFTTIEKRRQVNPELARIQEDMRWNELQRENKMRGELEEIRRLRSDMLAKMQEPVEVIEPVDPPSDPPADPADPPAEGA